MKKFLIKAGLFFVVIVITMATLLITNGGYVDYFYEKFTTPKVPSLILGDSRSMQGIQPEVLSKYLKKFDVDYELPMLNYSFTVAQIAYGPPYLNSIKKKLDTTTARGLFIVTVNPWILSEREADTVSKGIFFEQDMPPHNMKYVNHSPNFEYLIRNFDYFHFRSIIRRTAFLHKDGWLEESNLPKDESMLKQWKAHQVTMYKDFASRWKISEYRVSQLQETIRYLERFGEVYVVRMPISEELKAIEYDYWPSFHQTIRTVAHRTNTPYIDFTAQENEFKTYDGNHIDKFGGVPFTKRLCDSILSKRTLKRERN